MVSKQGTLSRVLFHERTDLLQYEKWQTASSEPNAEKTICVALACLKIGEPPTNGFWLMFFPSRGVELGGFPHSFNAHSFASLLLWHHGYATNWDAPWGRSTGRTIGFLSDSRTVRVHGVSLDRAIGRSVCFCDIFRVAPNSVLAPSSDALCS